MPCTYTGSLEGDRALLTKEETDRVTRYLCGFIRYIERHGARVNNTDIVLSEVEYYTEGVSNKELVEWWERHKDADKK